MREHERDGRCARCGGEQTRVVSLGLRGVPHSDAGHQTVYDYKHVSACTVCGWGEYLSHSHDCWDHSHEEPWKMEWSWPIRPEGIALLREALATCPDPGDAACGCRVHATLRHSAQRMSSEKILTRNDGTIAVVVPHKGRPRLVPESP